ncbi:MAG: MarR family transcriptional regulator [Dehalococcoidales bacterium]|nr:MarR family transcriptional regulator [Dehalococcoidales bacterium]
MRSDTKDNVAEDLSSTLPLIFGVIRRRLLSSALANTDGDISLRQFEIMRLLSKAGILHITEIGERLHIAGPQMTHLIDKLVDADIVERKTDTTDRRMINIALTNKGKATIEEHKSNIENAISETLSCLTDKELEDLSTSLRRLHDIFSKLV